jgi:hypothetical protein
VKIKITWVLDVISGGKSLRFDTMLSETIQDILLDVFGEKSANDILSTFEDVYSLRIEEIPEKTPLFLEILKKIVGSGYITINELILETMYLRMGLTYERNKNPDFVNALNYLENSCRRNLILNKENINRLTTQIGKLLSPMSLAGVMNSLAISI